MEDFSRGGRIGFAVGDPSIGVAESLVLYIRMRREERTGEGNPNPIRIEQGKSAMATAVLRYAVKRLGSRAPQRNYTAAADNIPGARTVRPTSSSRSSTCYGAHNSSTKVYCFPIPRLTISSIQALNTNKGLFFLHLLYVCML